MCDILCVEHPLKFNDLDRRRELFVEQGLLLGLFQNFSRLTEQPFVVENPSKIDLLTQLHRNGSLHVEQPDTYQNLLVQMGLHIGQLFLLDRTPLQDFGLIVLFQRIHTIEQRDELGLLISRQTGSIELEVPLLGLAHALDQIKYRLLFSAYRTHVFLCLAKQNY